MSSAGLVLLLMVQKVARVLTTNHRAQQSKTKAITSTFNSKPFYQAKLRVVSNFGNSGEIHARARESRLPRGDALRRGAPKIRDYLACVAGGILSRVRGQREAMAAEPPILAAKPRDSKAGFQSGSFPFSSRLRHPYSLSTVKILRCTRTIPPATQARDCSPFSTFPSGGISLKFRVRLHFARPTIAFAKLERLVAIRYQAPVMLITPPLLDHKVRVG